MAETPPRRQPQEGIPGTKAERESVRGIVRRYVESVGLVPPVSQPELQRHALRIVRSAGMDDASQNYVSVLVNNEVWRETVARTPYGRRLLLLPQCLRHSEECPAEIDEFGLLCQGCGRCEIGRLHAEAERLGYVVLVAEGTTVVVSLVEAGKIDAIVGVSCLSVLERVFPAMDNGVIPGVAVPLLYDGCRDTAADIDQVLEMIHMRSDGQGRAAFRHLDPEALRNDVRAWFTPIAAGRVLGEPASRTEQIAHAWLCKSGKRWRPFLAAGAYRALAGSDGPFPEDMHRIAVAVECFHKASLIHDDIEDNDLTRYGGRSLHAEYGTPVALNAGDLLVGEGYRLIAETNAPPETAVRMLLEAAAGHRMLSIGQGEELSWRREPGPMPTEDVIDIFRRKTAPAFTVALHLGALYAGADDDTLAALGAYSEALGIAYQIRDDLADFSPGHDGTDITPSLQLAIAWERAGRDARCLLERVWRRAEPVTALAGELRACLSELNVEAATRQRMIEYRDRAVAALQPLRNATLKILLRRVIGKIFSDSQAREPHRDATPGDARIRPTGRDAAR